MFEQGGKHLLLCRSMRCHKASRWVILLGVFDLAEYEDGEGVEPTCVIALRYLNIIISDDFRRFV